MLPRIDHIQLTVQDLKLAEPFYDHLMRILGFDLSRKSKGSVPDHDFEVIEYVHDNITIGINSPRKAFSNDAVHRRKPGSLHHLAFTAKSEDQVNAAYRELQKINANIVNPPQLYPQHGEYYYALFFKDPGGIKLEIVFERK